MYLIAQAVLQITKKKFKIQFIVLVFCYAYKGWWDRCYSSKYLSQGVSSFASIAFGYPNATLPGRPQTPAAVLPERRKGETPKLRRGGTSVYF